MANGENCILCQRPGAGWLVRLPYADRRVHKGCADRWYNGSRHIWPSPELCQQWLEQGPSWVELAYMTLVPRILKVGDEVIPPGFWPKSENGAKPSVGARKAAAEDPARFAFFRTRAVLEGEVEGALGVRKPPYRGFALTAASGYRILFMENPVEGNAIYVFFLDVEGCLEDVRRTKYVLRSELPPSFLGFFRHDPKGKWQEEVLGLLART